ncbi:MerR family transcriptional regulator [Priestia megaterium]|nr:MerR family transcriptional regulator [Priestia megaterium]
MVFTLERRWISDGVAIYKIGELAEMAHVTKRTIDYYTNIDLLKAERSPSNYRYYTEESLERLRLIEQLKKDGFSLEEIALHVTNNSSQAISESCRREDELLNKLNHLNDNIKSVLPLMEKLDESEKKLLISRLSPENITMMHSLVMLLS